MYSKSKLRRAAAMLAFLFLTYLGAVSFLMARKEPARTPPGAAQELTGKAADYVCQDTCRGCHEEMYKSFERTPHWQTTLETHKGPEWRGCEACHGPGRAHVEAMSEAGGEPAKVEAGKKLIFRFQGVSGAQINGRCLTCHQRYEEHANWSRGPHATNGVTCLTCHSPHHAKAHTLLVNTTPALCYTCHNEQKSEFAKPFRHRVNEGLVQCQDCHNVHGGYVLAHSLRTTRQQDLVCYKCHADKQGPFIFEHPPVRTEGCTSCHTPHGSVNARLLKTSQVNLLCLQCHTLSSSRITRPGSTLGNPVPGTPSFHNHGTDFFQACTLCHTAIHGSNGNAFFFR